MSELHRAWRALRHSLRHTDARRGLRRLCTPHWSRGRWRCEGERGRGRWCWRGRLHPRLLLGLIRVETDLRNEKINYKVREHSLAKVPHLLVVGKREAEEGTVAVRTLGEKEQKVMSLDEAIAMLRTEATPPDLRD